ncbi:RNA-binding motif protein, X chromosome-like isoform X1 [Dipodomys merriami]|uniref:RNA-binding motif protein, X chromosome-like isoform X1 n=1 Tax=Dipodomys merriami TaxID=94247 RepID=UPI00384D77B7
MESDQPRKLFVGGLSADTTEKDLEGIFCEFGHLAEVILLKHRQTKRSRGFAFITFERPADAQWAAKEMNGKCLDGKEIKVEPAGKPSYNRRGRGRHPPFSRNKVTQRSLSYGGEGSGGARGHSSYEGPFDNGRSNLNFNASSSRRHLPGKRSPSSRSSGPLPKRSDHYAPVQSSRRMREEGLPLYGGENYEVMSQRNPVSLQRDDYASARSENYSTEDRGDHLNSGDREDYAGATREYGYDDYGHYSSQDEHTSKGYSGRGGYDKSCSSGGSYRDDGHGNYHSVPTTQEFPRIYGGNNRYDDNRSSQHEYSRRSENLASSQSDIYYRGREYGRRQESGLLSSKERGYHAPRES